MNSSVPFSQKPIFWIFLTAIFVSGSYFSYQNFSKVFPVINLDITMNRAEALTAAKALAQKNNWGPQTFEQAALFDDDDETQNFIELEGGGKKGFAEILKEKYFSPYTWHVRHFKEGEINETHIAFTPEGEAYGFVEKLSENTPGAALTSQQALEIAQKEAIQNWNTDFSFYKLVDRSQETKPSGRVDHTFTYERTDKKAGEAPYRLKLVVSGDKLTEYDLSVKVPESFKRRYEHMRSFNNTIAQTASIIFIILYIFGGCFIGLFLLMRQQWLTWKVPFLWAGLISSLDFLNNINSLPFYWMNYNTQLSKIVFLINIFMTMLLSFIGHFGIFTLMFTAAESLGRKAFPQHLQLWRLWSRNAATSWQVLGRTLGGYLIVGFDLFYMIAFYFIAFRYFGWWSPSETLINPNILSYYVPWLASVSQALQAGFVEECIFRAIPLACAMLIGRKKGNKNFWLIVGMIVQAVIFSAAHANYPTQPGYARLVELLIPSLVFGCIYLWYGLLPSIISHFIYDLVLMALPVFLATAPGIWVDKVMVILAGAVPLLIVLNARFFTGAWKQISSQFYNFHWQPPTPKPEDKKIVPEEPYKILISKNKLYVLSCLGLLGLASWFIGTRFEQDALPLGLSKITAIQSAQKALDEKNITLPASWAPKALLQGQQQDADRFVWEVGGKNLYHQLRSSYIKTPQWKIRFAQFEHPDIVERAEEYSVYLAPKTGNALQIEHQLPETRAGKELSEQEARDLAQETLKKEFNLNPKTIEEISAVSTKQPERLDWDFTFKDPQYFAGKEKPSEQGQARITVKVSGNEVTNYYQHVFVPEEWTKNDQQKQAIFKILGLMCLLFLMLFFAFGATKGILEWINHKFAIKTFLFFFSVLVAKSLIQLGNIWSSLTATFKTTEPYWNQVLGILSTLSMQIIFKAGAYGLLAGFVARARLRHFAPLALKMRVLLGASIGSLLAGINALCEKLNPSVKPLWAEYAHASALFPSVSCALTTFTSFLTNTILLYLIIWTIDYFNTGTKKTQSLTFILFLLAGIAIEGASGVEHVGGWLMCGLFVGFLLFALYTYILKYSRSLIPLVAGAVTILEAVQQAVFNAYSGALLGNILSIALVLLFAVWWSNQLEQES